jgi:hypothetical protein
MPHVTWAELTERGYCTIDVGRDEVTAAWWFVRPDATDLAKDAVLGAAWRTQRSRWPPEMEEVVDLPADPPSPGGALPLPARPSDLGRVRLRRRVHEAGAVAAALACVGTAGMVVARRAWRADRG